MRASSKAITQSGQGRGRRAGWKSLEFFALRNGRGAEAPFHTSRRCRASSRGPSIPVMKSPALHWRGAKGGGDECRVRFARSPPLLGALPHAGRQLRMCCRAGGDATVPHFVTTGACYSVHLRGQVTKDMIAVVLRARSVQMAGENLELPRCPLVGEPLTTPMAGVGRQRQFVAVECSCSSPKWPRSRYRQFARQRSCHRSSETDQSLSAVSRTSYSCRSVQRRWPNRTSARWRLP